MAFARSIRRCGITVIRCRFADQSNLKWIFTMKHLILTAAVFSLSTAAVAAEVPASSPTATAAATAVIKPRVLVKTSNGGRVGSIDRVINDASGQPASVQIIYRGRFVMIPASTLTPSEKVLVTSLTTADVNKL